MSEQLLQKAFQAIKFKGTYGTTGKVAVETYKLPRIYIEGVGRLSWPISTYQIEQLKNVTVNASFEKRSELTVEEKLKKVLYIDSSKIEIDNCFDSAVKIVINQLGLEGYEIEARLNKLELHEEGGGGFDWHQDTDKSKGKIGSLLIHLPSYYEGGELFIKHEGTLVKSVYNQQEGEDGFFYTALHSACNYKLNTITKGHRFTLQFDLVMKDVTNAISSSTITNFGNTEARRFLNNFIDSIHNVTPDNNKQRFIFALEHKYSNANQHNICSLLQGQDREKLSLLKNMQDENGNDLFFIALGCATCVGDQGDEDHDYEWEYRYNIKITSSLPHSLFNEPAAFNLKLTSDEGLFSKPYRKSSDRLWYKDHVAVIWLTDHHFSIVSEWYDITEDICKVVKSHPAYGKKFVDKLITDGSSNIVKNAVAASTLLLREKASFLHAISCEPPEDTEKFYKIIVDSLENELVTWNEVIPCIGRFMGKFDQNQVKFFSNIKDDTIKLNFFNEIKKSANLQSTGLFSWITVHKEVNCSIDYIFENFDQKDDASKIELFVYCSHHQLLQKALELGKHLCSRFHSIFSSNSKSTFCNSIILNFIKLNDDECLRNLIEFLLPHDDRPPIKGRVEILKHREKTKNESIWDTIATHKKQTSTLIPYIFDFLEQRSTVTLNISQSILFTIFNLMIDCDKKNYFISTKQFYNLLFNRIRFDDPYNDSLYKTIIANKIIQMGDESIHLLFITRILWNSYWKATFKRFTLTSSFSNILCDFLLNRAKWKSPTELFKTGRLLIDANIDNNRLTNLLFACSSMNIETFMQIAEVIITCGRAIDCNLCALLADCVMKDIDILKERKYTHFLLNIVRNDDIGEKFLHAVDMIIANNNYAPEQFKKKMILVHRLLFNSYLHLECNIFNYSSGFLLRIKNLISFEMGYVRRFKKFSICSWVCPDNLLQEYNTCRQSILKFLKQDIPSANFGLGDFTTRDQAENEASEIRRSIPDMEVTVPGSGASAYYTIRKKKRFASADRGKKTIQKLTNMLECITSNNDDLKNLGLSIVSTCEDEPNHQ